MGKWILIVNLIGGGNVGAEFGDLRACAVAREAIERDTASHADLSGAICIQASAARLVEYQAESAEDLFDFEAVTDAAGSDSAWHGNR